ncbi:MAG: helix-turn-helix domain-containing protein [Actinomycetota bacterium]
MAEQPEPGVSLIGVELPPEFVELIAERVAELLADRHPSSEPPPYLTVDQAAEYLACKPKRVYDLCSQRRLPFRKDGSRTLLRRADLDAYLEGSA